MREKVVYIEWDDSCHNSDWKPRSDAQSHGIAHCHSVGFLLKKSKAEVVVFQSKSDTGNITDMMAIPRKAIRSLRYIDKEEGK